MIFRRLCTSAFASALFLYGCAGDGDAGDGSPTIPPKSPTPTAIPAPRAVARRIVDSSDLIGGPRAVGRVGDYLLANDLIRVVVSDVGRAMSSILTYGGNIVDADLVRPPGAPGKDSFGGMTPLINISSTVNVQRIEVVNDGSNGEAALIRTLGVDDLFDAIDPSNAVRGLGVGSIPIAARDVDLPVDAITEYSLNPGESWVRITTTLVNRGNSNLRLYVGDFVNGGGELDVFVPSLGFGLRTLTRLAVPYAAYTGTGSVAGLSYGYIPEPLVAGGFPASAFSQAGINAFLIGQDVLSLLLGGAPGALEIPEGGRASYVRHFVVGDGDVDSIAHEHDLLVDESTGIIAGRVSIGGLPASGATVAIVSRPGDAGAEYNVINSIRGDATGYYEGSLPPGNYLAMAKLDGYPYDSLTPQPIEHPVTINAGTTTQQDFALPAAGRLRVATVDENDAPIPAKVSLVGFDPAPDPGNTQSVAVLSVRGFVFGSPVDQKDAGLFGLTTVKFIGPEGDSGEFVVPPGEYDAVISRGPEYSIHRQRVVVPSNQTVRVNAKLVRVLDTSGFVSADYHVHLINSLDSGITPAQRILTMVAEGVEYFVASDHDFLTDVSADIIEFGAGSLVRSVVSAEITTFNVGHFGAWPLVRDPHSITGGAPDWGRADVTPGMDYPSLGTFDLSPAELLDLIRTRFDGNSGVVQINHLNGINNRLFGYFHLAGIDTGIDPPQSFTDPALLRQNPAITNLYSDDYSAAEIWTRADRRHTERFRREDLGDWLNLLNQGRIKTATANSDTHSTAVVQAGGPRNFVASSTDSPESISDVELTDAVNAGHVIASNAPFVRIHVEGDIGTTAGLGHGESRIVTARNGRATIHLDIQSAIWAEFDRIEIFANAVPQPEPDRNYNGATVPIYVAAPTRTLNLGSDFEIQQIVVAPGVDGAKRLQARVDIPITLERDTWVVVVVSGTDGISRPLWPMNPQDLTEATNTTLDDLTDGNLAEGGNTALAFTNALFIDVDGNGRFDPPGVGRVESPEMNPSRGLQ